MRTTNEIEEERKAINMTEVFSHLYVGDQKAYEENKNNEEFAFINACKEPYHRQVLGYTGRSCDKNDPEYLYAIRGNRLICNLVDVPDVNYIQPKIIDKCLEFIHNHISTGFKVLINCNLGESRSPIIAMLYMATMGCFTGKTFYEAEEIFKDIYPKYNPAKGMRDYAINNWDKYANNISNLTDRLAKLHREVYNAETNERWCEMQEEIIAIDKELLDREKDFWEKKFGGN